MALAPAPELTQEARLDALLERIAELQGQRNAIDAALVDVVAALAEGDLWAATGASSIESCVAWKTGASPSHARALTAVAARAEEFPRCVESLRSGRASLDQVAAVAERALDGTDDHYAPLVEVATVTQLRRALRLAPRPPADEPATMPTRSISCTADDELAYWRIVLPHAESAVFEAALQSHLDALVAEWRRAHGDEAGASATAPPFPTQADGFMRLVELGWDADVAARPHGQRTTVVLHLDLDSPTPVGQLHLGPALSASERAYLSCNATVETWFERAGVPIGVGRESRQIPRRLRRALERRDTACVVPGCGATRGLHAHHLLHWLDGGGTELDNLALICPHHHRAHHRGIITIAGPADRVVVCDAFERPMCDGANASPPDRPPPDGVPYAGPTGERFHWWWYQPPDPPAPGEPDPRNN